MRQLLDRLKLIHKVNIVFYISILLIVIVIGILYSLSRFMTDSLVQNYEKQLQIEQYSNEINNNLKLLDYLTIQNALTTKDDYEKNSQIAYASIMKNLELLKQDAYFVDNNDVVAIIKNIQNRIIGYKDIINSFESEVEEGFEDSMYAVLALSTTSNIISKELEVLRQEIKKVAQNKYQKTKEHIQNIRLVVICVVVVIFMFMVFVNKQVVHSIMYQLNQLKEGITSFFDVLSKKRKDTVPIAYTAQDEISQIAKIIDNHVYIAKDLLLREREEAQRIEQQVAAATKEITQLNNELEATQREVVFTMGAVAEERSKETGYHVKRVAEYSLILARLYGLNLEESILLKNASPMHDIGKIGIPDDILNKPGRLTEKEFDIMKQHSEIGYKMLKHSRRSILKAAATVAYEHHEKWDGSGYPRGLKGEAIHIYGRITAIADVFDALGSDRVYKKAWKIEKILDLFQKESGKHFDPELVDLFIDNLAHFLAAKENIENDEGDLLLSRYLENFEKVGDTLSIRRS